MEEATPNRALPNGEAYEESPVDMFGVLKQGFARLSESLLGWGSKPSMRKSKSADHALEEDGQDSIEMAHFHHQQSELKTKGHDFVLQHLSNPTWCDECGDFIWGLYKQCLRCRSKSLFVIYLLFDDKIVLLHGMVMSVIYKTM